MRKIAASIVVFAAVGAMSQGRPPNVVVVPSSTSAAGPLWDKGVVDGHTYKNASLGLQLTAAPKLEFGTPEMKGNPGTIPLLVTVTAVGEGKLLSAREVMSFSSDAMAYYPANRRSTADYMRRVVFGNRQEPPTASWVESPSHDRISRKGSFTRVFWLKHVKPEHSCSSSAGLI